MAEPTSPTLGNISYWAKRFAELHLLTEKNNAGFLDNVAKQFKLATKSILEKVDRYYRQFSELEGISYSEAQRLLNSEELEEFHMSIGEYQELLSEYERTREHEVFKRLERASLKYRVTRLEAIELQLMCEVCKLYFGYEDGLLNVLKDNYIDRYYRSAFSIFKGFGIGTSFSKVDTDKVELLLQKPWTADGENFSERVWKNRDLLVDNLATVLTQASITGEGYGVTTEKLRKKMDAELYKCKRIVATESAYFSSLSQKNCWNELGVREYEIVAVLDMKTSEICQNQDGRVYKQSEFEIGKTAPPFHPNCRSTTAPYYDDRDVPGYVVGERAARGLDGKTYFVPADLTYKEWYKKYILDESDK